MSVPVFRVPSGLGIINASGSCETLHEDCSDWLSCRCEARICLNRYRENSRPGKFQDTGPTIPTPRMNSCPNLRGVDKHQEPRSLPEPPEHVYQASDSSCASPANYVLTHSPDISFAQPSHTQMTRQSTWNTSSSEDMTTEQKMRTTPLDASQTASIIAQKVSKELHDSGHEHWKDSEAQAQSSLDPILRSSEGHHSSEPIWEDLSTSSVDEVEQIWIDKNTEEAADFTHSNNEAERMTEVESMDQSLVASPERSTDLTSEILMGVSDYPVVQSIAIRSRCSLESFREFQSPTQSHYSHPASMKDEDSVVTPSTTNNSRPSGLDDETSDSSPEYWNDADISEDEHESSGHQFTCMPQGQRTCATNDETARTSKGAQKNSPKLSFASSQGKKRVREGDHRQEGDDDDQKRRRSAEKVGSPQFCGRSSRFACPFFKRMPLQHLNEVCVGPGFKDIKSLKEHLGRKKHRRSLCCLRCWGNFDSQTGLNTHMRLPEGCQPTTAPDCVTDYQWGQLHARHNFDSAPTEEDKWRVIYRILWPDEMEIPCPYYEYYTTTYRPLQSPTALGPTVTTRYDPAELDNIFRRIRHRFDVVLVQDPQIVAPRFRDSGIPRAVEELERLFGALILSCQLPLQTQVEQESTINSAPECYLSVNNDGIIPNLTPASSSQQSDTANARHEVVTPLEEDQDLGASEPVRDQMVDQRMPDPQPLDISLRLQQPVTKSTIDQFVLDLPGDYQMFEEPENGQTGWSDNFQTGLVDTQRPHEQHNEQMQNSSQPDPSACQFGEWIREEATMDCKADNSSASGHDRFDSVVQPVVSWHNGPSPVIWSADILPSDLLPTNPSNE